MVKLLFSLACLAFSHSIPNTTDYLTYCNSRFDFCIKYPGSFQQQPESENQDGTTFLSKDKLAKIWAYGRLAIEDLDQLKQEYEIVTRDIKVNYKVMKNGCFIFSGIDKQGNIIYQKTCKKKIDYLGSPNTDAFHTLRISYPPAQGKQYQSYCQLISKSLK